MDPSGRPHVVRETQQRLRTNPLARVDALRRQISETQRRLKEWNEKCERKMRESQQQLADAEKQVKEARSPNNKHAQEMKDEHARAIAEQQHMVDLELAKMELKYARAGLEYQRKMRRDEGQLEDVEEQLKKLEGDAKEKSLRLRRRLRVAVKNAEEEIELIEREFDVEKRIHRALAKREQAKMRSQQKKELLQITSSLDLFLQLGNTEVDQLRSDHAKKKAGLEEELARYQAELARMDKRIEKGDTSKSDAPQ